MTMNEDDLHGGVFEAMAEINEVIRVLFIRKKQEYTETQFAALKISFYETMAVHFMSLAYRAFDTSMPVGQAFKDMFIHDVLGGAEKMHIRDKND